MSKIKIEKDKFVNFLRLVVLSNDIENKEALVDVQENSIKCLAVSADKSLGLKATLKHPFTKLGQVGLDVALIKKLVETIGTDITVEFVKNRLIVKSNKTTVWFPIKSAECILNNLEEEKFNAIHGSTKGISFVLSKEVVGEIVSKFNLVDSSALVLKVKDNALTLKVSNLTNEVDLESEIELKDKPKKNFNIKIGRNLVDLLSIIDDEVEVSLAEENPSSISVIYANKKDGFEYSYLVALVDNGEEEAPTEPKAKKEKVNA